MWSEGAGGRQGVKRYGKQDEVSGRAKTEILQIAELQSSTVSKRGLRCSSQPEWARCYLESTANGVKPASKAISI